MFKGRHFDRSVILLCIRWYLAYNLSLRNLEEMMVERGISVDHATIHRWVIRHSSELLKRFNSRKRIVASKDRVARIGWRMLSAIPMPLSKQCGRTSGIQAQACSSELEWQSRPPSCGAGLSASATYPDHSFEAADSGLRQGTTRVPRPLLPTHAPMLGNALAMPIALSRSSLHIIAQHCR
jgi:hypothetical protein